MRHRRGFTLLEIILAMGMIAMLSLTLYMSMSIGVRARDSANAAVAPVRAATIAADLVCHDLESVMTPTDEDLAGEFVGVTLPGGGGRADQLHFTTIGSDGPWEDKPLAEGVRRVQVALRTDINPPSLTRKIIRNLLTTTVEEPEEEILCRNVKNFSLRYWDGTFWQDTWDSTQLENALPLAVEMTLEIEHPDRRGIMTPVKVVRLIPLALAQPPADATAGGAQ